MDRQQIAERLIQLHKSNSQIEQYVDVLNEPVSIDTIEMQVTLPVKDWIEMQKACDIGIAGRIYQCLPQQFSASMPLPSRFRDKSIFSNINDATDRQRLLLEHLQKCFKYLDSQQKLFITQVIGKYSIDIALALVYLKTLNNDDKVASGSEELIQNLSQDATIGGLQWTRNLLILQATSNYPDQFKQECKSQLSRALLSPRGLDHLMQCLMPGLEDSSAKDVMQEAKALVQIISTPPSLQICSRQAYLENIAEQLWQLIINPNAYCGVAVSVLQRILSSGCELSDYIARVYSVADERLEWRVRGLFYAIDSTSEGNLNTWLLEGLKHLMKSSSITAQFKETIQKFLKHNASIKDELNRQEHQVSHSKRLEDALGYLQDSQVEPYLRAMGAGEVRAMLSTDACALIRDRLPEIVSSLINAIGDKDSFVRSHAQKTLLLLAERFPGEIAQELLRNCELN